MIRPSNERWNGGTRGKVRKPVALDRMIDVVAKREIIYLVNVKEHPYRIESELKP